MRVFTITFGQVWMRDFANNYAALRHSWRHILLPYAS